MNYFDLPALRVPAHFDARLFHIGHWQRGQQSPDNRTATLGRSQFARLDGPQPQLRLAGFAGGRLQSDLAKANRQCGQPCGLFAASTHSHLELPVRTSPGQGLPEAAVLSGQFTVVLAAHQQMDAGVLGGGQGLSEQIVEVPFAVGDVDQEGVRTLWSQLLTSAQAVEPFLTFLFGCGFGVAPLGAASGLGVAGAHGGVKHSQGLTAGSDGQSGVEKKADNFLAARADGTQSFGLGMSGIVEARGVLESQHDGGKAHALQRGLMMSVPNPLRIDRIILEEAIGTLGSGARAAGLRDGGGGLLSEGRGNHEQALGATIIAEFSVAEFGDSPGCGLSRLRAERGCICIKHPTTKYITC